MNSLFLKILEMGKFTQHLVYLLKTLGILFQQTPNLNDVYMCI